MPDIQYDTSILPPELVAKLGPPPENPESPTQAPGAEPKQTETHQQPEDTNANDSGMPSPPVAPAGAPKPGASKEEINAYLKTLTHDQLKEFEAYNAHVSRAQAKIQQEHQRAVSIQNKLIEWDNYFNQLSKEQLADAREDDQIDAMYRGVKKWRSEGRTVPGLIGAPTPAPAAGSSAEEISKKMRAYYQSHPEWAKIVTEELWGELAAVTDPAQMLIMLSDARVNALRAADREKFEAEVKAQAEEARAATHRATTKAPPKPAGAAVDQGQGLTMEQYLRMSPTEAAKLTAEQIDSLTAEIRR